MRGVLRGGVLRSAVLPLRLPQYRAAMPRGTAASVYVKGALLPHRAARGTAAIQRAAAVKTKIFSFSRIKFLKKSAISATIYKSAIETQI